MSHEAVTSRPGVYALILYVAEPVAIDVGRLGSYLIAPGWYAYIGSAHGGGGLSARIGRHMRTEKKPHWHIDYLLPKVALREVWFAQALPATEHKWVASISSLSGASAPIPGFGSSDCKAGCDSHLVKLPSRPDDHLANLLESDSVSGQNKLERFIVAEK